MRAPEKPHRGDLVPTIWTRVAFPWVTGLRAILFCILTAQDSHKELAPVSLSSHNASRCRANPSQRFSRPHSNPGSRSRALRHPWHGGECPSPCSVRLPTSTRHLPPLARGLLPLTLKTAWSFFRLQLGLVGGSFHLMGRLRDIRRQRASAWAWRSSRSRNQYMARFSLWCRNSWNQGCRRALRRGMRGASSWAQLRANGVTPLTVAGTLHEWHIGLAKAGEHYSISPQSDWRELYCPRSGWLFVGELVVRRPPWLTYRSSRRTK